MCEVRGMGGGLVVCLFVSPSVFTAAGLRLWLIHNPRCFSQNYSIVICKTESFENPQHLIHDVLAVSVVSNHLKTKQVRNEEKEETFGEE